MCCPALLMNTNKHRKYFDVLISEMCQLECVHGTCQNQRCRCDEGWSGAQCDRLGCEKRCYLHGHCDNGTCICKQGWNGKHCSLSEFDDWHAALQ